MRSVIKKLLIVIIVTFFIGSCGGGGGSTLATIVQNSAPTISTGISTIRVGEALNFTPSANDPDGDNLVFSI
jgi:hypothetical protein